MRGLASLELFAGLSDAERHHVAVRVASALGAAFRASTQLCGFQRLAAVVHEPTGCELVVVPGGDYVKGLRAAEVEMMRGAEYVEDDAFTIVEAVASESPPHEVSVGPFLCARAPLLRDAAWALLGREDGWVVGDKASGSSPVRFQRSVGEALLAATPFRLLTAAEWEWVARDGGLLAFVNAATPSEAVAACNALYDRAYDPNRDDAGTNALGIWGLPWGTWTADASAPHRPLEERGGVAMLYPFQNDEIIAALCAFGDSGNEESCLRFALDLPSFV